MSKGFLRRAGRSCRAGLALLLLASLALAACGGGDSGSSSDVPLIDKADKLTSADFDDETEANFGAAISNGQTIVFTSENSIDDVRDFYADEVVDGWTAQGDNSFGEMLLRYYSNDDNVAIVLAMSGAMAKESRDLFSNDGEVEIDFDALDDNETLIAIARFTCEEDEIQACLDAVK